MKNSKKMSLRIEQQLLQIPKNQHGVPHTLQGMKNQFAMILFCNMFPNRSFAFLHIYNPNEFMEHNVTEHRFIHEWVKNFWSTCISNDFLKLSILEAYSNFTQIWTHSYIVIWIHAYHLLCTKDRNVYYILVEGIIKYMWYGGPYM